MTIIIKYSWTLLIIGIVLTAITSCSNDVSTSIDLGANCPFVQDDSTSDGLIDERERSIMDNCGNSEFTNFSEIKDNLTGDWELVGHGEGWLRSISQPCASIIFKENRLNFTD